MAWVKTAMIPDRLGPNDRTSDGEKGAGFKEGRQRRQRLCARDHGKEQQYEFSFSILNIWRLYHEKMNSIFDVAGRRRRICETQGSPHEEGVLYALGFKVGTSLNV